MFRLIFSFSIVSFSATVGLLLHLVLYNCLLHRNINCYVIIFLFFLSLSSAIINWFNFGNLLLQYNWNSFLVEIKPIFHGIRNSFFIRFVNRVVLIVNYGYPFWVFYRMIFYFYSLLHS